MIVKRLAVRLDWSRFYVVRTRDSEALMRIVERAVALKRGGYSGPYQIDPEGELMIQGIEMVDIELPDNPDDTGSPQPSIYTSAVRGLP